MENKYRAVKNFIKRGKRFSKKAQHGCFDEVLFAHTKGSLKLLDEGDYQKFSSFLSEDGRFNLKGSQLFLEEKMVSYKNYDFWPEDQRIKEREYKRERNLLSIRIINKLIDILVSFRNWIGN